MTILNDDQARLLEAYCDALALDRNTPPPADLDPEFAAVARHLAAQTAPEPDASTLADIRARLLAPQPPVTTYDGWQAETWSASPMAMRMPPPASPQSARIRESAPPPSPMIMRAAPPPTAASLPPAAAPPPAPRPAHPAPAAAPPSYGSAPPPAAPPTAAYSAPTATPARGPSFPTRLAGALLGTLIAAVAIGVLVVGLVINRPPVGQGSIPTSTVSAHPVACGAAPAAIRPTPTPALPPGVALTATAESRITATVAAQTHPTATRMPIPQTDPCAKPHADSLTLDQAADIVRKLLGQPDAIFYAYYQTTADPSLDIIVVERPFPAESELIATIDRFEINASTGTLIAFSWVSRESISVPAQPIDESEAIARAEAFAREQYQGFDRLERRSVQFFGGTYPKTEVVWQLRAGGAGAWLPTSVRVSVSRRTGLVIGYWRSEMAYNGRPSP